MISAFIGVLIFIAGIIGCAMTFPDRPTLIGPCFMVAVFGMAMFFTTVFPQKK